MIALFLRDDHDGAIVFVVLVVVVALAFVVGVLLHRLRCGQRSDFLRL